jgi:SH3 domain-containing YSC84-like protein 1
MRGHTSRWMLLLAAAMLAVAPVSFARQTAKSDASQDVQERLENAGQVLQEVLNVPEGIPKDLLDKARCVVVMPSVLKGAFIIGASYGRGVMVCRTGSNFTGPWGAPAMYALEGGSLGFQIGGQATDYVFLVMNDHGANSLLHSKVKLGADVSVAGGPVGRSASADTDAYFRAEILSYSRSRGIFAGVSVEGSTLRPDNDADRELYGRPMGVEEIVKQSEVQTPDSAAGLVALLQKASPNRQSS